MSSRSLIPWIIASILVAASPAARADEVFEEWSGYLGVEGRGFASAGAFDGQDDDATLSLVLEPEYFREWNDGRDRLIVRPFARLDSADDERTHLDLRELYWQRVGDGWELDVGVRQVFWGVTESAHLVDIVNQTDAIEDLDGEDKLGQPMVRVGLSRSWGQLDLFVLPGFRERTFAGRDGRLRPPIVVEDDAARYASAAEHGHVDVAARWSQVFGDIDLGVSYFRGTSREPLLRPEPRDDAIVLVPFYPQIDQLGLDLQATLDAWLWKLEVIARWSDSTTGVEPGFGDHLAAVGGFEYSFFDWRGSGKDIGLLVEYLWDERDELATTAFEDDVFVGSRIAWNDVQSTELLVGAAIDRDSGATFVSVEGSRRIGDRHELEIRLRAFAGAEGTDPLVALLDDDYLQVTWKRYF